MAMNREMTMAERGTDDFQMEKGVLERDRYLENQMKNFPQIGSLDEAKFLLENKDRFAVYQIGDHSKGREYRFMKMDYLERNGIKVEKADYQMVYSGRWEPSDTLEGLFERFNMERPQDFTGHSMSVSDVIAIKEAGELKAYYVDSFSFRELPDFIELEQLRQTERAYQLEENEKGYRYLEIHEREEGFDYTFYDGSYKDMDGGIYDNPDVSIDEAVCDIMADEQVEPGKLLTDYAEFQERVASYKPLAKVEELEEANYNMIDNVLNNMPPKKGPYLEYYAAGCDEYHDMSVYYRSGNLQEMAEKYREFLDDPEKLYLGCGLGIIYRDPDDPVLDGSEVGIVEGNTIRGNKIDSVAFLASMSMAHEAVEQIRSAFPELRYYPPKDIRDSLYPEEMTTEQLAVALSELVSGYDFYDYQDNYNPEENIAATMAMELRCGKAHTFIPYLKDIVEEENEQSLRAEVLLEKIKAYTPDVPEKMEPLVAVRFCEKSELTSPKYQKLGELDRTVSDLDAELSSKVNEKTGLPEETYRMYFTIYYADEDKVKNLQGKIDIGDGTGGIIGHLKTQNEIRLTDESSLAYQQSKGEELFQAYMSDLTDMQEHVLPYLQSFCSLTEKAPEREESTPAVTESKDTPAPSVPDTALKSFAMPQTKGLKEKQGKKSIHERLKINKEMIAKQQGKDSGVKGVEAEIDRLNRP